MKVIDLATRAFFLYGGEPECVSAPVMPAAQGAPGKQLYDLSLMCSFLLYHIIMILTALFV